MVPEGSSRRVNTVAYRAEANKLKKLYPQEFLAFIDGQLVGHSKESAELFSEIRRRGIGGNTLSDFLHRLQRYTNYRVCRRAMPKL